MTESFESGYASNNHQTMDFRQSSAATVGTVRHAQHAPASSNRPGGQMLTPPPSATQSELTARMDNFSMNSPGNNKRDSINSNGNSSNGNNSSMPSPLLQNESIFAQNRAILLSGLPPSPPPPPPSTFLDTVRSAAAPRSMRIPPGRQLAPLRISQAMSGGKQQHDSHPDTGQSPRVRSPCVYVKAVNLPPNSPLPLSMYHRALTPPLQDGRLCFSALVRPNFVDHQPFAIQREFDLEELIQAVPTPGRRAASSVNILPSPVQRSPLSALPSLNDRASNSPFFDRKFGTPQPPPTPSSPYSRTHSRQHSRQQSRQSIRRHSRQLSRHKNSSPPGDSRVPLPMLPHPNLGYLPALAAVILSGYVQPGDSIDLPLPCPEAWPQTIAYIYKGTGELTGDIKRNIAHLGGRID